MDTLYAHCAGLDVHKDTVVVWVRHQDPGGRVRQEVRTFGTVTRDLLALSDWLAAEGVSHAAMESTGVYWRPVHHLLEGRCQLLLVNAQHMKNVPGRKTDVKDCAWIAQLLPHGLLRASFVPPPPIQELRELTRQRTQLVAQKASVANRIQKVLEDANIKLGSVACDVLGKSGRARLEAMIAGETDPEQLADLALRRMRQKIPQLQLALTGPVTEHHRFLLRLLLDEVLALEGLIERLEGRSEAALPPWAEAVERLTTIPGIDRVAAAKVVAELGTDMTMFPTAGHATSWVGISPGNNESAGRRRGGRTTKGNRWLRQVLVQCVWAASQAKGCYLAAQYRRLAARRGKKRALVAVAHTLLEIIYHVLKRGTVYQELGADYFDRRNQEGLTRHLVKRLESLGNVVILKPVAEVAG
jgi:transposase